MSWTRLAAVPGSREPGLATRATAGEGPAPPARSRPDPGGARASSPAARGRDPGTVRGRGSPARTGTSAGARKAGTSPLGLPDQVRACLFDLDGVLTRTAEVHAAAWKEMFDQFLRRWADRTGGPFRPFDPSTDYDDYVDGMPRTDGVRSFLASRGITLPEGRPGDAAGTETVVGLGRWKNEIVQRLIRERGVRTFEGSVRYVHRVRARGLPTAVVSSSKNCLAVLRAAGISDLFDVRIDGIVAERDRLKGKPAPDTYLAAARTLGVGPGEAAVFEDALAGVASGRAGHFAFVVGVDRVGQAEALRRHGADVVVRDLAELLGPR